MGPDHKGETCDGDISGIKVILDTLEYVGVSFVYAERCFKPLGASRRPCTVPHASKQSWTPSMKDGSKEDQGEITAGLKTHKGKVERT